MTRRGTELPITALFLLGAAAICWIVTADRMRGMDMGPGTDLGSFGWFAGVWAVMMAAMMLPSLVPMAAAYAQRARGDAGIPMPRSLGGTPLFVIGYLLPWAAAGALAWMLVEAVRNLDPAFLHWDEGGRYVAAAVIACAALYQLSSQKARCLTYCREPQWLARDWRPGPAGALRMGIEHGGYCIGCCWALMAALFALGVMSITWMVVIAALIAIERLLPWRASIEGATVALLLALALGVAFFPEQVPGLTVPSSMPAEAPTSMPMSM
jgi:predicted metal-binding membrane protein